MHISILDNDHRRKPKQTYLTREKRYESERKYFHIEDLFFLFSSGGEKRSLEHIKNEEDKDKMFLRRKWEKTRDVDFFFFFFQFITGSSTNEFFSSQGVVCREPPIR